MLMFWEFLMHRFLCEYVYIESIVLYYFFIINLKCRAWFIKINCPTPLLTETVFIAYVSNVLKNADTSRM